jgi:hypothetical protein
MLGIGHPLSAKRLLTTGTFSEPGGRPAHGADALQTSSIPVLGVTQTCDQPSPNRSLPHPPNRRHFVHASRLSIPRSPDLSDAFRTIRSGQQRVNELSR